MPSTLLEDLKRTIEQNVVVREKDGVFFAESVHGKAMKWMFDFRAMLLDAVFLERIAELFWNSYEKTYPFQVGGLETASIPLITAIVLKGKERGTPVNGFYIRKSRKPEGLQKIIEGRLTDDPVILVDDLINAGGTFLKQIVILEKEGKIVRDIFALVRFRNPDVYTFALERNIKITAPFLLEDFNLSNYIPASPVRHDAFEVAWVQRLSKPNYFYRLPKSAPAIDAVNVYFGNDDGVMRALRQEDGSEVWRFKILGFGVDGKTIFSSPALYDGMLYYGAYDGNFYALDAKTGKKKWVYMDADWIGSSPCVAENLGLVYVGLEYGLWKKKGGIVALDAKTGKKKWEYISMPEYTHGSPAYSKKFNLVAIGSNDGCMYLFNASDGRLLWKLPTGGEIKMAPAFDEERGYLIFGSLDGKIYIVTLQGDIATTLVPSGVGFYSTPLISNDRLFMSGLDKNIYCANLDTLDGEWLFTTKGRVFASPAIYNHHVYVGSNDGCLYELNANTGENTAFFQTTERITNKVAYNADTERFFLLTYANELYCLKKRK